MLAPIAAVLTLGAYLLHGGQMSLGTIYVMYYYTTLLSQSLYAITYQVNQLQSATASIQRITELYDTPTALVDGVGVPELVGPERARLLRQHPRPRSCRG